MIITATRDLLSVIDYVEDAALRAELDRERAIRRSVEQRRSLSRMKAHHGWVRSDR